MPQSLANVILHFVFSTKDRLPLIGSTVRPSLHAYLATWCPLPAYIDNQEEHHRTQTFQDEFRAFLKKYGIDFDERYVWD